jgi:hypothetical protein
MPKADTLEIGQAFYGSFSGYHDYRILAASPAGASGFSREDREIISLRSNLGGSAQTVPSFAPFLTFYDLGRQRPWAFSRTVWFARGPRGNDYLVHVLAISAEVMEALRGDPFLLLEFDLFMDSKPPSEEPLEPQYIPLKEVAAKAIRPCGADLDPRIPGPVAASFLRTLNRGTGTLSLSLDDGEAAASLCRSIVSLLPPDDRVTLSFCSRFSLPRRSSFRLAVLAAEDAPMAERYLNGFNAEIAQGSGDLWSDWVSACQSQEVEPFYGVSLSKDTASGVLKVVRKLPSGEKLTQSEEERLGPIALNPSNRQLPSVQRLRLPLAWKAVRSQTDEMISAGSGISLLEEACRQAWFYADDQFLAAKISEAARGKLDAFEMTAILAMAVLVPDRARPGSILVTNEGPALFQSGQLASWTLWMSDVNREACHKLLFYWFVAWFRKVGPEFLQPVLQELGRLKSQSGPKALVAVLTAFSALWDIKPEAESLRNALRADLLAGRKRLGPDLLPDREVGRLVLEEGHLEHMKVEEAEALLRVTCRELPKETESWMTKTVPDTPLLVAVASACEQGVFGFDQSSHWSLIARIAEMLAGREKTHSDAIHLARLLNSAAARVAESTPGVGTLAKALEITVKAKVQAGEDLILQAGATLVRKGDTLAARAIKSYPAVITRSYEMLDGSSAERMTWEGYLLNAAVRMVVACPM